MDSVGLNGGGRGKFRKDLGSFVDRFFFGGLFLDSSNALIYISLTTTFLQLLFYRLLCPKDIDDLIAGNVSKGSGRGCGSPEEGPRVPSKKLVVRPPLGRKYGALSGIKVLKLSGSHVRFIAHAVRLGY